MQRWFKNQKDENEIEMECLKNISRYQNAASTHGVAKRSASFPPSDDEKAWDVSNGYAKKQINALFERLVECLKNISANQDTSSTHGAAKLVAGKKQWDASNCDIEDQLNALFQNLLERLNQNLLEDDKNWHNKYIFSEVYRIAKIENINLNEPQMQKLCFKSVKNKIQGLYRIEQEPDESFIDFSIRVYKNSSQYRSLINEFKAQHACQYRKNELQTEVGRKHVRDTMEEIKNLIEMTDWNLGKWGSRSRIHHKGTLKPVPNHMYQIYKACHKAESSDDIEGLLQKIQRIAADGKKPQTGLFFQHFRKRDETTSNAYLAMDEKLQDLFTV